MQTFEAIIWSASEMFLIVWHLVSFTCVEVRRCIPLMIMLIISMYFHTIFDIGGVGDGVELGTISLRTAYRCRNQYISRNVNIVDAFSSTNAPNIRKPISQLTSCEFSLSFNFYSGCGIRSRICTLPDNCRCRVNLWPYLYTSFYITAT